MNFSVIAAVDEKWGIGKGGRMPWHEPEDFKFFKRTTKGSTCFMGRRTYEELALLMKGKPELLPTRQCVVVSSKPVHDDRVETCTNIIDYKDFAGENNFFIGGSSLFGFGLTVADTVYLTRIPGTFDCDTFFPSEHLGGFEINKFINLTPNLQVGIYMKRT